LLFYALWSDLKYMYAFCTYLLICNRAAYLRAQNLTLLIALEGLAILTFQCWGLTIVFTSQTCVLIIPYILFTCLCFYNYLAYLWCAWVIAHPY
jgi:hypothetical protein